MNRHVRLQLIGYLIRYSDPALAVWQWRLCIVIVDELVSVCLFFSTLVIVTVGSLLWDNAPSVIKQVEHIHGRRRGGGTRMNLKFFCCSGHGTTRLDRSIEVLMLSGLVAKQVHHDISDVDMTLVLVVLQLVAHSGSARKVKRILEAVFDVFQQPGFSGALHVDFLSRGDDSCIMSFQQPCLEVFHCDVAKMLLVVVEPFQVIVKGKRMRQAGAHVRVVDIGQHDGPIDLASQECQLSKVQLGL